MLQRPSTKKLILTAILILLGAQVALADDEIAVVPINKVEVPCAVLTDYDGSAQVLNSLRLQIADTEKGGAIPCGGWISVSDSGWMKIKHKEGFEVILGPNTFLGVVDPKGSAELSHDHFILYKGIIHVKSPNSIGEVRIVTSNGRAKAKRGQVLVVTNNDEESTQLTALSGDASLENRFEPAAFMKVGPGESSTIDPTLKRVYPNLPKAISIADLRPRLLRMRVSEVDQREAYHFVKIRQERTFASTLVKEDEPVRKIASTRRYMRHVPTPDDGALRKHWVRQMVGGDQIGERVLYPDQYYGKSPKATVIVEDPTAKYDLKQKRKEDDEKRKLIDELSKIRVD